MSNQLRNKMYDFEVKPPLGSWDKIATALNDQKVIGNLSTKLFDLEVPPPESAWQQIKNNLEHDIEVPVSKPKLIPGIYRYAAAVVLIAMMVFVGIKLLQNNSGENEIAANRNTTYTKDSVSPSLKESLNTAPSDPTPATEEKRDDAALEESKRTVAKNDFPMTTKLKLAKESYLSAPAHYIENISDAKTNYPNLHFSEMLQPIFSNESETEDLSDRYIMLKSPDGNFFRMSKKLADLICCISGEDQDANCKDQLQRWREKIACSSLAPSPGNFMDILNLITSLQNDNN
ncbi:MAG TPA: hypothetical protein VG676_04305 [Chitinophagaceae bacterium]|nr:hypothetical protein [Chitinophagaceae bacterium]